MAGMVTTHAQILREELCADIRRCKEWKKKEKKNCVRCTVTVNISAEPEPWHLMLAENYKNSKSIYLTIIPIGIVSGIFPLDKVSSIV